MQRWFGAIVIGAALGVTMVSLGSAAPAGAQCAAATLIPAFEGIAVSYEQRDNPTRFAWTFRLTAQPQGLSLPDNVVVEITHDPPAGSSVSSVEESVGDAIRAGAHYSVTAQSTAAADGTPRYVVDACGGSYRLLVDAPAQVSTSDPLFGATTPTTISAEHAARSTWKFLLGALGLIAVAGGVFRTATGRQRK
jgi:hypothetical protein